MVDIFITVPGADLVPGHRHADVLGLPADDSAHVVDLQEVGQDLDCCLLCGMAGCLHNAPPDTTADL